MGNGSPTVTGSPQVSPKKALWCRLQLPSRQPRLKPSICSSTPSGFITAPESQEPCTLPSPPAPPRPPRPMTSLPNLRPTVILSPIAIPATAYIPSSGSGLNSRKPVSFSDDVFAALPGCFGKLHSYAGAEAQDIGSQHFRKEFKTDVSYASRENKSATQVQIGHGYIQRQDGNVGPSAMVPSPYASSSCLGTSLTSYCQEHKYLEFSLSTFANTSRTSPDEDIPTSEQNPGNTSLVPLRDWVSRYRRALWMLGTILFVLVASSAIITAIIWKLTTCELIYSF